MMISYCEFQLYEGPLAGVIFSSKLAYPFVNETFVYNFTWFTSPFSLVIDEIVHKSFFNGNQRNRPLVLFHL